MTTTLDDLASPADADMFRMTVDYGRWYIDPLPGCDIAPATEDQWPSCSTVKKASEKDWSFLVIPRVAAIDGDELKRIGGLDRMQRADAFKSVEKHAKQIAFGRGTIVHAWKEDLLAGREPREITEGWLAVNQYPAQALVEAKVYLPAILDFFNTYQPEPVAVEYVTVHRTLNGHGYGATPDALVRIESEVVGVEWKTRGEGSNHAAYAEEAAQIACGARAEYMVARSGDHAERRPVPYVAGGYVVSIKPDGARLYPIDIDKAFEHWERLHAWWVHRLDEKASIGRVLPKRSGPKTTLEHARERMASDAEHTRGPCPAGRTDRHQCDCYVPDADDEGGSVAEADVTALQQRFEATTESARLWFSTLAPKSNGWLLKAKPTVRRLELYKGVLTLAEWSGGDVDEVVKAVGHLVTGDDSALFATTEPGRLLGSLDAEQAAKFAATAGLITQDLISTVVGADGTLRLQTAA